MAAVFAPASEKRLVLTGAVVSSNGISSTAIIKWESPAGYEIIRIGDHLEDFTIADILIDRVVLVGKAVEKRVILLGQSMTIESNDGATSGEGRRTRNVDKQRTLDDPEAGRVSSLLPFIEKELPKEALQLKLAAQWSRLLQEARWAPHFSKGELAGVKILRLPDLKGWPDFGLRENDVITSVNDVRLNDPSAVAVFEEMARTQKTFDVLLERDGNPIRIRYVLKDNTDKTP
jgi:type II secretion system protein C